MSGGMESCSAAAAQGESLPPSFEEPLDPRRHHMITASRFGQATGLCKYVSPKVCMCCRKGERAGKGRWGDVCTMHDDSSRSVHTPLVMPCVRANAAAPVAAVDRENHGYARRERGVSAWP